MPKIPKGVTINVQLQQLAKHIRIPYFRGIFMRTILPTRGIYRNKNNIVNLDNADGLGTHWVAYSKRTDRSVYFDSFGNLQLPKELLWFGRNTIALSTIKAIVDNCVYSFYKRLTINLRINIALFQFSLHLNISLTFTLTGKNSVLAACYFPTIGLSNGDWA